jgi:putative peptidoglycan lipid II flippase
MTYSLGLLGFIAVKVLAPGFFARQDTKTPVAIGVIAMVANMLLTAAFVLPMLLLEIPGAHAALALATALAAYLNAGLLFVYLRRAGVYRPLAGWGTLGAQTLVANSAMAALLWFGVPRADMWSPMSISARAGQLLLWIVAAGVVYLVCLIASGVKLKELIRLRTS